MATTVATGIRGPRTRDLIISSSQACAQAHSVAFELWPRLAPRRHCAELLEQTKHVNQRPVLDDLPGGVETVDVDQLEGGLFAGRGEARELAVMGSGAFHPAHGFVTLGDLVFNNSVQVGKGSANLGDKLPHPLDARTGLRAGDVVKTGRGGDGRIADIEVVEREPLGSGGAGAARPSSRRIAVPPQRTISPPRTYASPIAVPSTNVPFVDWKSTSL